PDLGRRVRLGREPEDELSPCHVDRSQDLIAVKASVRSPPGPGCADEAHGVDQHPVQVEHDRPRVKVAQLRGVIFDLDGVLAVSEALLAEAAIALFAEKGLRMTAEDFKPFIGMGEDRYIGGAAETRGIELDLARDKAQLYVIYQRVIRGRLQPLPGAREFVAGCRRRGLAAAVASGADKIKVYAHL